MRLLYEPRKWFYSDKNAYLSSASKGRCGLSSSSLTFFPVEITFTAFSLNNNVVAKYIKLEVNLI